MKKSKKIILIACLLACVLAIGAVVGYFIYKNNNTTETYAISLNAGDDAILDVKSVEVKEGGEYRLPVPTKVGFNFTGWKMGDEIFSSAGVWNYNDNVSLTASWEAKTYSVTLNTNGGALDNATLNVTYGSTFTLPTPSRVGYEFGSWKYNDQVITDGTWVLDVDALILNAEWIANTTKLTLDLNGGALINTTQTTINVAYGSNFTFPNVEYGAHKILKCWKDTTTGKEFDNTVVWDVADAEITLTAVWLNDRHTLTLNLNGATEFDCDLLESLDCGTEYTLPTIAKKGYYLLGWYVGEDKIESTTYKVESDVELVAKWQKYVTTVKYSGEGITFENDSIEYGTQYTLETLDSTTYVGWRIVGSKQYVPYSGTWDVESTEITLEPVKNVDACIVTFSGDSVNIASKIYTKGEIVTAPVPQDSKAGHYFGGWARKGSTIPVDFSAQWNYTGELELVALWNIKAYTITFDANGGEFVGGETVLDSQESILFGDSYDFTDYAPTLAGYEFIGWMYDSYFLGPVEDDLFLHGKIILEKGDWLFDGSTTITLKAVWISLETGFGPNA